MAAMALYRRFPENGSIYTIRRKVMGRRLYSGIGRMGRIRDGGLCLLDFIACLTIHSFQ